ncbi:peptidoglycan-binding protein [Ancylobacter sp. Lp-2]|uniref:peptidoglycan-binding domain-containing protein n=1 Tax=Ancylobacter sp. Lp-2 TaxID=2881339 RepID=UPI001E61B098|nr:peptidoglycan-binding domain-containing protein [Ancylobacter sp. Lp-2]MCB4768951.1 peptidoglycan-binding protein [Ancylobacter sp. Lp-2]
MPRSYASDLLVDGIDLGAQRALVVPERPKHRRSDLFMVVVAAAASAAVIANAFVLQDGRRESNGTPVPPPAPAASRPAPSAPAAAAKPVARSADTDAMPAAAPASAPAAVAMPLPPVKPPVPKPVAKVEPAAPAAQAAAAAAAAPVRPPAEVAVSARMVEVQKALARLGYGPIRIDGRASEATEKAIKDFERDRRLPVTGQISDRLVKELNAVAGFSIQ